MENAIYTQCKLADYTHFSVAFVNLIMHLPAFHHTSNVKWPHETNNLYKVVSMIEKQYTFDSVHTCA